MFSAVRAVLKMGMPLINASRRFSIPYPTLFYYTNRVRQLLKPYEIEDTATTTTTVPRLRPGPLCSRGSSRPPGKRGRPTKVYLGTWKDEDLTQAILRVVYKDYIPESMDSLVRSVERMEESAGCWPSDGGALPDCEIIPVESQIQELVEDEGKVVEVTENLLSDFRNVVDKAVGNDVLIGADRAADVACCGGQRVEEDQKPTLSATEPGS